MAANQRISDMKRRANSMTRKKSRDEDVIATTAKNPKKRATLAQKKTAKSEEKSNVDDQQKPPSAALVNKDNARKARAANAAKPADTKSRYMRTEDEPTDQEDGVTPNRRTLERDLTDNEPSTYYIGDPRIPFVTAFVKRGVKEIMHEFSRIRNFAPRNKPIDSFNKNPNRNRYADVTCLDSTRVVLKNRPPEDDYIHANRVTPPGRKTQHYICTQGPLQDTIEDFWQMVLQENAKTVVMLCDFTEQSVEKCAYYYPMKRGESAAYGAIKVTADLTSKTGVDSVMKTRLIVQGPDSTVSVNHYHWPDWHDHTAPEGALAVVNLLKLSKLGGPESRPVVVHCSAGIGRTGTFVAIDYINEKLKTCEGRTSMPEIVKEIRHQRVHSIQSAAQYIFLHVATLEFMLIDNANLKRTAVLQHFCEDYCKYLKRLRSKLAVAERRRQKA